MLQTNSSLPKQVFCHQMNLQWPSLVAQLVKNPAMWETWVQSLGWEDPLEKGMAYALQYSGLENSMDFIVHGVAKSQTQLSDFYFHYSLSSFLSMNAN